MIQPAIAFTARSYSCRGFPPDLGDCPPEVQERRLVAELAQGLARNIGGAARRLIQHLGEAARIPVLEDQAQAVVEDVFADQMKVTGDDRLFEVRCF